MAAALVCSLSCSSEQGPQVDKDDDAWLADANAGDAVVEDLGSFRDGSVDVGLVLDGGPIADCALGATDELTTSIELQPLSIVLDDGDGVPSVGDVVGLEASPVTCSSRCVGEVDACFAIDTLWRVELPDGDVVVAYESVAGVPVSDAPWTPTAQFPVEVAGRHVFLVESLFNVSGGAVVLENAAFSMEFE